MQDNSDLIIRDCCEAEAAEFGKPDTICITVDVLREIVQRHFPGTCLHQIQEPAAAEQAAWHAGQDEGRAQAARPVVVPDDMPSTEANTKYGESYGVDWVYEGKTAAPAAVAVSGAVRDLLARCREFIDTTKDPVYPAGASLADEIGAALAATPAAVPAVPKWIDDPHDIEQGQMLNPEWVRQQQPAIMPKGESAAAQLRAMATNYPSGHSWDKLDAKACIRGALEIEALRALLPGVSAPAAVGASLWTPISKATPEWTDDDAVRVIALTAGHDFGGVQVHDIKASDFYLDDGGDVVGTEVTEVCTHWAYRDAFVSAPPAAPQAQADARDVDGMYYLQDARWSAMVGNCPSFWRSGGGYTTSLDDAERFTLEAAMKQHKCRETDLPWLCAELDKLRRPTVDCQYMPRSWDAQRAAIAAQASAKEGSQG